MAPWHRSDNPAYGSPARTSCQLAAGTHARDPARLDVARQLPRWFSPAGPRGRDEFVSTPHIYKTQLRNAVLMLDNVFVVVSMLCNSLFQCELPSLVLVILHPFTSPATSRFLLLSFSLRFLVLLLLTPFPPWFQRCFNVSQFMSVPNRPCSLIIHLLIRIYFCMWF